MVAKSGKWWQKVAKSGKKWQKVAKSGKWWQKVAKSGKKQQSAFYCDKCDYKCCKKYNWEKTRFHTETCDGNKWNHLETDRWQKVASPIFVRKM